jgi:predicted  nucleic acid-binding Zn-ribbon protein
MNRPLVITAVVAVLIGLLAGFLWWGIPTNRLQAELSGSQANAVRLGREVDEARAERQRLEEQLKAEKAQHAADEAELRRERERSARLQGLISEGRK